VIFFSPLRLTLKPIFLPMQILLVDDDVTLSSMTREYLETKHLYVTLRHHADMGLQAFKDSQFDLCILDIQMPGQNGFELAEKIRKINSTIPIIFLSGKIAKEDRIHGFEVGADDYITKPFSLEELYLRILALQRRMSIGSNTPNALTINNISHIFHIGQYTFNIATRELTFGESTKKLSSTESRLLELLCEKQGNLLKREDALVQIWGENDYFKGKSMNVFITKLRNLLAGDKNIEILNTHGEGYKLIVKQ
jgi:two-component system, OmpR family, response regulator